MPDFGLPSSLRASLHCDSFPVTEDACVPPPPQAHEDVVVTEIGALCELLDFILLLMVREMLLNNPGP